MAPLERLERAPSLVGQGLGALEERDRHDRRRERALEVVRGPGREGVQLAQVSGEVPVGVREPALGEGADSEDDRDARKEEEEPRAASGLLLREDGVSGHRGSVRVEEDQVLYDSLRDPHFLADALVGVALGARVGRLREKLRRALDGGERDSELGLPLALAREDGTRQVRREVLERRLADEVHPVLDLGSLGRSVDHVGFLGEDEQDPEVVAQAHEVTHARERVRQDVVHGLEGAGESA